MKRKNTEDARDVEDVRKVLADMKAKNEKPIPWATVKKRLGLVFSSKQRKQLQAMIDADGLEVTRTRLHISRHTLERAAGGLTIQRGTAALLGQHLQGAE